jgi:response regulator NasT
MDLRLDDMDGLEASFRIIQQRPLPIVIMTALSEPGLMEKAESAGAAGYVVKPFSQKELETALWLAWSRHKQMQTLKNEIGDLQDTLKARKLIERAKGLLMERKRISEADAYKRMQTMSRNRNIPMMRLAEAIIMTDKLAQNTEQYPKDRGQPVNSTNKRV